MFFYPVAVYLFGFLLKRRSYEYCPRGLSKWSKTPTRCFASSLLVTYTSLFEGIHIEVHFVDITS